MELVPVLNTLQVILYRNVLLATAPKHYNDYCVSTQIQVNLNWKQIEVQLAPVPLQVASFCGVFFLN